TFIAMPEDLPIGTTVEIRQPAITVQGLAPSGELVKVVVAYSDDTRPSDDFLLILGVRGEADATKTGIHTLNEQTNRWEYAGGWGASSNGRISVTVPHFSTYGVFTDTEGPSDIELA